jgi:hypothetical protein
MRFIASERTSRETCVTCQECVFIGQLPSAGHGADHVENTSNTFSIFACAYFGRCLEMGLYVAV